MKISKRKGNTRKKHLSGTFKNKGGKPINLDPISILLQGLVR